MLQVVKINEICIHIDSADKIFNRIQEFRKHYDEYNIIFVPDNCLNKDVTANDIPAGNIVAELEKLLSQTKIKFLRDSRAPEFLTLSWIKDGVQWRDFGLLAYISSYVYPGGYIELVDSNENELAHMSYIIYFKYYRMLICPGLFVYDKLKEIDATEMVENRGEITKEMIHLKRYRTLQ